MENKTQISRYLNLLGEFKRVYGEDDGQGIQFVKAPARINIIGEHIDYIDYFQTAVLTFGEAE